jgi:hypothetical protein
MDVKRKIEATELIDVADQRFLFHGGELPDELPLADLLGSGGF